jgi:hypothetical protein
MDPYKIGFIFRTVWDLQKTWEGTEEFPCTTFPAFPVISTAVVILTTHNEPILTADSSSFRSSKVLFCSWIPCYITFSYHVSLGSPFFLPPTGVQFCSRLIQSYFLWNHIKNYFFHGSYICFIFYFFKFLLFICGYNVWVITPPSPCPLPPQPPHFQAETILALTLILLKREYKH